MSETITWAALPSAAQGMLQEIATACQAKMAETVDSYNPERELTWTEDGADNVCTFTAEWTRGTKNEVAVTVCTVTYPVIRTTDNGTGTFLTNHSVFAPTLRALEEQSIAGLKSDPTPDHRTFTISI